MLCSNNATSRESYLETLLSPTTLTCALDARYAVLVGVKRAERVCSPWRETFHEQIASPEETALFLHPMIRFP